MLNHYLTTVPRVEFSARGVFFLISIDKVYIV